jgi:hypothetical protein
VDNRSRKTPSEPTRGLRDFLEIPYDELEELNLEAKQQRLTRVKPDKVREQRMKYLTDEKRIKAVTVCFTDLEGRLHMLDYDKKFLLGSADNLTFDGSSIRGFSAQQESDLRLGIDWPAFYWLPADVFGPGKVLVFGEVLERDGAPYQGDLRAGSRPTPRRSGPRTRPCATSPTRSRASCSRAATPSGASMRPAHFEFISTGGYYHSLPGDAAAHVHRPRRRGAAGDGLREREGPPRGRAVAVRDELQVRRGGDRRRPGPALQAPGRQVAEPARHDRVASCPSPSPASTATACTPTCPCRRRA